MIFDNLFALIIFIGLCLALYFDVKKQKGKGKQGCLHTLKNLFGVAFMLYIGLAMFFYYKDDFIKDYRTIEVFDNFKRDELQEIVIEDERDDVEKLTDSTYVFNQKPQLDEMINIIKASHKSQSLSHMPSKWQTLITLNFTNKKSCTIRVDQLKNNTTYVDLLRDSSEYDRIERYENPKIAQYLERITHYKNNN